MNAKVTKLLSIKNDLEGFDFEGLKGEHLWDALWLVRKIKHIIEGTKKAPGIDEQGRDMLFLEAESVEGVYDFSMVASKRLDQAKFEALICERFKVDMEALKALKDECKNESSTVRLNFSEKYSI